MAKLIFNLIFSTILAPFNLYCSSWIFKEVLNLSGITFNEFIKRNSNQYYGDSHREQARKRNHIFRFFDETSSNPKKSKRLLLAYGISTLPTLAALLLAQSCAFSQDLDRLFTGNLILVIINILLIVARIIYKTNNPLDAETEKILAEKRAQELKNGKSKKKKNIIVYGLVGLYFIIIFLIIILGNSGLIFNNNSDTNNEQQNNITQNNEYTPNNQGVSSEYVYSVLNERGFNTYEIPTTYWSYDEEKLMHVCAGVKGNTKFEFYEYYDDLTTDMTYYGITCDMAPNMEAEERSSHETQVSHDSRLFTFVQDGFYYLAMYKSNTIIYAYSPDSQSEIQDILTEIGYLSQTK